MACGSKSTCPHGQLIIAQELCNEQGFYMGDVTTGGGRSFSKYQNGGRTKTMDAIVFRSLTNSFHKRLAYMEGRSIRTLNAYAKKHRLSHPNLINKAKRQTIEAFLEHGEWRICE